MRLMPAPTILQRVDVEPAVGLVEDREARVHDAHLDHLGALLLAARKADIDRPLEHSASMPSSAACRLASLMNSAPENSRLAARSPLRIESSRAGTGGRRRRGSRPDTGSRGTAPPPRARAAPCASRSCAVERRRPVAHLIARPPAEHIGERRLARAVRPHDRMHFARGTSSDSPLRIGLSATAAWRFSILSIVGPFRAVREIIAALHVHRFGAHRFEHPAIVERALAIFEGQRGHRQLLIVVTRAGSRRPHLAQRAAASWRCRAAR